MMEEVFWEWVKEVNWVTFGIAPLLSGMAGYVFSVLLFEVIITLPWCGLISYQNKKEKKEKKEKKGEEGELKRGREERWANIEKIQAKFPFWRQFFGGLMTFISPVGWVNAVVMAIILSFSIPSFREQCWGEEQQQEEREEEREELKEKLIHYFLCGWGGMVEGLPGWGVGVVKFLGMVVVNDFFLYWGHRVQHESEFLWNNFHYFHHQLTTPTPVGTVFIHPMDATLQGGIPILLSAIITQPHPLTFSIFVFCRVAENVANHAGIDSFWLEFITMKTLPLRAKIKHHDSHHRFSNYSRNAKNYSEAFWVWDYLFGTFRKV